jgi:hypothetical protein
MAPIMRNLDPTPDPNAADAAHGATAGSARGLSPSAACCMSQRSSCSYPAEVLAGDPAHQPQPLLQLSCATVCGAGVQPQEGLLLAPPRQQLFAQQRLHAQLLVPDGPTSLSRRPNASRAMARWWGGSSLSTHSSVSSSRSLREGPARAQQRVLLLLLASYYSSVHIRQTEFGISLGLGGSRHGN